MTALPADTAHPSRIARATQRATVDVLGVRWPLYKVEALGAGLITLLLALAITAIAGGGAAYPAVLAASVVTVTAWWALRLVQTRR